MGFADNMRILSNINCGLASATTFLQQKANGVNPQYATMNLFGNLANGIAKNLNLRESFPIVQINNNITSQY